MEFKIEKKGYSVAQVDVYIAGLKSDCEKTLAAQKERIDELKRALETAEKSIKAYKEKSSLVTKAIYNAVAKAEEIERLSQIKYNQEIEQLKAFHDKWISYYNKILERYPLDEELMAASKFNNRMRSILAGGAGAGGEAYEKMPVKQLEENYEKETERLQEKRIGYVTVKTKHGEENDESDVLREMLPDCDMSSPIVSGNFDPIERINRYFSTDKSHRKDGAAHATAKKEEETSGSPFSGVFDEYSDRSESGFSFEEALNPKEDLSEIMKELGLFSDD